MPAEAHRRLRSFTEANAPLGDAVPLVLTVGDVSRSSADVIYASDLMTKMIAAHK